jgi:hypothetical protein
MDRCVRTAEMVGDILVRHPAASQVERKRDVCLGQFRRPVLVASGITVPLKAVMVVVVGSSGAQVPKIHARWVIAVVADHHSIRNWPVGDLPSDAVRSLLSIVHADDPVAVGVS